MITTWFVTHWRIDLHYTFLLFMSPLSYYSTVRCFFLLLSAPPGGLEHFRCVKNCVFLLHVFSRFVYFWRCVISHLQRVCCLSLFWAVAAHMSICSTSPKCCACIFACMQCRYFLNLFMFCFFCMGFLTCREFSLLGHRMLGLGKNINWLGLGNNTMVRCRLLNQPQSCLK